MTNGGHGTELLERKPDGGGQAEWSDSAPSNFLPLPWTLDDIAQTLLGSEKMMLQLRVRVFRTLFVLFYGRFKNRLSCLFDIHLHFASMYE